MHAACPMLQVGEATITTVRHVLVAEGWRVRGFFFTVIFSLFRCCITVLQWAAAPRAAVWV